MVDHYPPTFLLWIGVALLTPVVVAAHWRQLGRVRRLIGVLAAPVAVAAAFALVNLHYGYWPTLGDLLGHPVAGQVSASTLTHELQADAQAVPHPHHHRVRLAAAHPDTPAALVDPGNHLAAPKLDGATLDHLKQAVTAGTRPLGPTTEAPDVAAAPLPAQGQFAAVSIPATTSHFVHRWDYVYLPPAWFGPDRSQLGVLVLLAGTPSSPDIWATGGGAVADANAYARAHHGVAPVMLFIDDNGSWNGDTECVNGPRGQAETYVTQDVVHFAEDTLQVTSDPAKWGIVGFSEGGTCAFDLALRHPDLFHHFVDLAGDAAPNVPGGTERLLFGGSAVAMDANQPAWLLHHPMGDDHVLTAWFGVGIDDNTHLHLSRRQAQASDRAGIDAAWFVGPDGHNWQFCTWALHRVLPELAGQVGPGVPASQGQPRAGLGTLARTARPTVSATRSPRSKP